MYIKVDNGAPVKVSHKELTTAHPEVSFPRNPSDETLAEFGLERLHESPRPDADIVTELEPVRSAEGHWVRVYEGRNLTAEEKRQNMVVTMRQARLALHQAGKLSLVDDAINLIPEPDKSLISIEWEYASTVDRMSPWVSTMGAALGLSDDALDQLFETARTL